MQMEPHIFAFGFDPFERFDGTRIIWPLVHPEGRFERGGSRFAKSVELASQILQARECPTLGQRQPATIDGLLEPAEPDRVAQEMERAGFERIGRELRIAVTKQMHGAIRLSHPCLASASTKSKPSIFGISMSTMIRRPGLLQGFEGVRGAMMRADDLDARRPTKEVGETLDRQRLVVDDHDPEIAHGRSSSGTMIRFSKPPPAEASARRLPRSP